MVRVVVLIVVAAIAVAIAWQVAQLPGEAVLQISGLTIEASAPVMLLGAAILFLLLYLLVRLLVDVATLPRRMRRGRTERNRRAGDAAVGRALVALAAGDAGGARREATRSRRLLGDSTQTLLLTAQAGRLAGREEEAEQAFQEMTNSREAAFLGYRGLMRQAVARQDFAEAEQLAIKAEAVHPGSEWLREERARLAVRAGAWRAALSLSGPEAPKVAFATAAAAAEHDLPTALRIARQAWRDEPGFAPAALVYADKLRAAGRNRRAQAVLRTTWEAKPQPDVGESFLRPISETVMLPAAQDPVVRLGAAERLCVMNQNHPESLILRARAALGAGYFAEARRYAEAAQRQVNQRRVWVLLADIEEREHGNSEATREAFRQATLADPDPVWQCENCGTAHPTWLPTCPACGQTGRIAWRAPPPAPVVPHRELTVATASAFPTASATVPVVEVPISEVRISDVPVSDAPVSDAPVSDVPVSDVPVSGVPVSGVPVSDLPVSRVPVSDVSVSEVNRRGAA